ncbi:cytochrome P450 [Lentithecium fluviatile CBS 122367]|uniref:Cytochrome P450 n=1 Tax=Lentithecium fluviatile CBS 122367 TaxID=1168545 RepID=A0A6G1J164_9PLEO|nr:cytochrome P450 [Lentithecium fluviatile CBS 122367]
MAGSYLAQQIADAAPLLTPYNIFLACVTYLAISIVGSFVRAPRYPISVPWVGHGKGWLSAFKNVFSGFSSSKAWVQTGYEKYSKSGKAFVLPSMLGAPAETVIPQSQMQWLLEQPDSVLSTAAAHYDTLQGDYSFVKPVILKDPYHEHVIHKNLARNLNAVVPELDDEIRHALDHLCGLDTEQFVKMDMLEGFMMKIIPIFTNRMLVGLPLCRNQDFLDTMLGYTMDVIRGFLLFALVPKLLHPIVGAVHSLGPKYHYWRSRKYTRPLVQKRLHDIRKKDAGDPEYKDWKEPNDFVTWSIRTAMAEGRQDELDPGRIAIRIMPLNFASIHTTAMTGQGVLIDVLSADPSVVEALREEAERIYKEEGNRWTKNGLSRMYRMDSAIRESQRHSAIALTFVSKKVMVKEGITTPEGVHLEYGTNVGCPWLPAANDPDIYEKPDEFDAFRYSREREEYETMNADEKSKVDALKLKQSGLVTTGNYHLPFGHGRHACPGRFFVAHELKMLFGHMLIHYDVRPLAERPKTMWVGRTMIPPKAVLEVRRRRV